LLTAAALATAAPAIAGLGDEQALAAPRLSRSSAPESLAE
jgi:hypothetical protein